MILEKGDMWQVYGKTDLFCITTNSILKDNGCLVMGKGIALEANERIGGLSQKFGKQVSLLGVGKKYGLIVVKIDRNLVGAFQTKTHWSLPSNLNLIKLSTLKLFEWLMDDNALCRVDMPFPGINNGKLDRDDVLPIIRLLPDNVHVWELE